MPYSPSDHTLDLRSISAVILDMDGVIWRGAEPLPGVPNFFMFLRERQIPYALATNNSSKNIAEYVTRTAELGIPIEPEFIISSGTVTVDDMQRTYPAGTPIYVIGSPSLSALMVESGFPIEPYNAQVVVVGLDVSLTYDKLKIAGQRILAGADFIGTNADLTLPTPDGLSPGCGTILAALQAMTGRVPRSMGKPEPAMFHLTVNRLGTVPQRTLMIGDRMDTDIEGAARAGLKTALVLTGVSTTDDIGEIVPDGVYESLADLHAVWKDII